MKPATLLKCEVCSKRFSEIRVADQYFEYPPLIVLLDLLLLREKAFSHVLFNQPLGKRPIQLGVLALIADTFHNWMHSEHWRASIFDELYSIHSLFEIQQLFYLFLYRSAFYHAIQAGLLLVLNQLIFAAPLRLLLKAFLLALSVKNIYIPLLVWQTAELPAFAPTIFTQVISTLFLSYELDVLSEKRHAKAHTVLFAAFAQVVPYMFI